MKAYFSTLLCICVLFSGFSQRGQRPGGGPGGKGDKFPPIKVVGKLLDGESKTPLEFATVSAISMRNEQLVGGGITDENGNFDIAIRGKKVKFVFEYISYESYETDFLDIDRSKESMYLGKIEMFPQGVKIDGVEIRAEKSETQFALDKRVFNVGKDLANRGGSAEDILDNVPSVTVDIEGTVSLRGSEGVRILVDGKPSSLAGIGNSNGLRSIPANMIDRVEVITNPSARYEAEGMAGIINIVLKKDRAQGFNGTVDVSGGFPTNYGISANLNYRKNNLNWFVNYGINYRESPGSGYTYQEIQNGNQLEILDQDRDMNRTSFNNSVRFGLDYFLSDKEQITAAIIRRTGDEDNLSTLTYLDYLNSTNPSDLISTTVRSDDEFEDELNQEYSLSYNKEFSSKDHKLSATVQFNERAETEGSDLIQTLQLPGAEPEFESFQISDNDEGYSTLLFQVDYVHPFSKLHKWEIGARSTLRDVKNDFFVGEVINGDTLGIPGFVNDFLYNEDIHAVYGIYGNGFEKMSYQVGLRAEYSQIQTELPSAGEEGVNLNEFLSLFPSGHFNYKLSDTNSWQISYTRRVRRPRFWDLNPFFTFSDPRNFFSGNPLVNPQFTDSYELSNIRLWEAFNFTGSIFYRHTEESIQRVQIVDADQGTTLRLPINIGEINDLGLDLNASYRGLKWLRLDGNFSIFRNSITVNPAQLEDKLYDFYRIVRNYEGDLTQFNQQFSYSFENSTILSYNGRLTARFTFWGSDLQLRGNYRGPRASAQGQWDPVGSLDIGWSKDFLKRKLSLTLSVRDLFNSRKRRGTTEFDNFYQYSEFQWRARTARLTASYRINQKQSRRGRRGGGQRSSDGFEGGEF